MATILSGELASLRQSMERTANSKGGAVTWSRPQVDAALQAVEDYWERAETTTALTNVIEAAAPRVFDAAQKAQLLAFWLSAKGGRERKVL